MATITKQNFISCLEKSRVIDAEKLAQWLSANNSQQVTEIAGKLVRDELLTPWQAKYLLSGRHRLDIGSYRLLERIERDELGDRFLAIHTQLGRKVEIQILPADLTKDKDRCESFIQKSSQSAKLDHPNLVHVYDIDQEGGRYFLVTEHVEGVTLDKTASNELSDIDIARMVYRAAAGLQFAHENDVEHGGLSRRDLIVGDNHSIKIQNLALSPLRRQSNGAGKLNDFQALAAIYGSILKEIQPDDKENRIRLKKVLAGMYRGDNDSIQAAQQELADWLGDYENESFIHMGDTSGEFDFPAVAAAGSGGFDSPVGSNLANSAATVQTSALEEEFDDEPQQSGFLSRMGREQPLMLVGMGLGLGLILLAGAWGVYALLANPDNQVADRLGETTNRNLPSNQTGGNTSSTPQSSVGPITSDDKLQNKPTGFENVAHVQAAMDNKNKNQSSGTRKNGDNSPENNRTNDPKKSNDASKNPGETKTPPEDSANRGDEPKDNKPAADSPKSEKPTPEKTGDKSKSDSPQTAKSDSQEPTPDKKEEPQAAPDPFKGFPKVFALPPRSDTSEVKIAGLKLPNRFLLGLDLFAPPESISKYKQLFFLVERSSDDKQKWIISVKKRESDDGDAIATFRRSESAFLFQWLPEAESNREAGYLQNCFVKLHIPTHKTELALRKPVPLEPLMLTEGQFTSEFEAELGFLPDESVVSAEIFEARISDTLLNPAIIDFVQGVPARVYLTRDDRKKKDPLVHIQVAIDFRSKLKARSDLVVFAGGQAQPIKNESEMQGMAQAARTAAQSAQQAYNAAKAKKAPRGQGEAYEKIRKQLKSEADSLSSQTNEFLQYMAKVPDIVNHPIGIRVYASYSGYQIELARTKMPKK